MGEHIIEMRVIDRVGIFSRLYYRVHVLGPRDKESHPSQEKTPKKSTSSQGAKQPKINHSKEKHIQKKHVKPIDFFDPPDILIQDSRFIEQNGAYTCITRTKSCGLNLTLSGAEK